MHDVTLFSCHSITFGTDSNQLTHRFHSKQTRSIDVIDGAVAWYVLDWLICLVLLASDECHVTLIAHHIISLPFCFWSEQNDLTDDLDPIFCDGSSLWNWWSFILDCSSDEVVCSSALVVIKVRTKGGPLGYSVIQNEDSIRYKNRHTTMYYITNCHQRLFHFPVIIVR
jgi:hypothetical protein